MIKLPNLFSKKTANTAKSYLGVFLKEEDGVVFFIKIDPLGHKILDRQKFKYSNGWDNLDQDIDEAIYKLERNTKQSPDEAIFFIYSHIIDKKTKDIKSPYLEKIKNLVKNLELKPLGYIECHEAVAEDLKEKEKIPLTAVVLEFGKSTISLFVYRAGRLVFSDNVTKTDNIIEDLLPSFETVRREIVIPSRIILYDTSDLDTQVSRLVTHRWREDLFVQMPKVKVIQEDDLNYALLNIFVSQILKTKTGKGFTEGVGDIEAPEEKNEVMGFVIGADAEKPVEEVKPVGVVQNRPSIMKFDFGRINKGLDFIKSKVGGIKIPESLRKGYLLPAVGTVLIIVAFVLMEYLFHTATVTVFFPSEDMSRELKVEAYVGKRSVGKNLGLKISSKSAEFSSSKSTTGKKEVGEKATGEVVVHNFDDSETTIAKGANLKIGGIEFTLDSDVKVASSSLASDGSAKLPGKAKSKATAKTIGPEGNINKGQRMSVGDLSDSILFAIADRDFSGGTKKQIQTASQEDLRSLRQLVLNEAKKYADKEIASGLDKKTAIIKELNEFDVDGENFSSEAGAEADNIELKSNINITSYIYNREDFLALVQPLFKNSKDKRLTVKKENIRYKIRDIEEDSGKYILDVEAEAKLTQEVKESEIMKKIVRRRAGKTGDIVKKEFDADGIEFSVKHPLWFLTGWMPVFEKNIDLKVSYL